MTLLSTGPSNVNKTYFRRFFFISWFTDPLTQIFAFKKKKKKKNHFLQCKKLPDLKRKKYFQKNNKNCMILHCKNAEMTIVISAFLQCKIIHFLLFFFSPIQIFFRLNIKICFTNFFFFSLLLSKFFEKKICKPSIEKKIRPYLS